MVGNTKWINDAVYFFEQEYRSTIYLHQIVQSDVNVNTGQRKIVKKVSPIICCRLPIETMRKFIQDIGYLAANKNFTYGALNDFSTTSWLIRKPRLGNVTLSLNNYIVCENQRYDEVKIITLVTNNVFVITGKAVTGALPCQIHEVEICHNFLMQMRLDYGYN